MAVPTRSLTPVPHLTFRIFSRILFVVSVATSTQCAVTTKNHFRLRLDQPSSVCQMATGRSLRNFASTGSIMRCSSAIRLRIVRVDGGSYPFVGDRTNFLKRSPPAARNVKPPSTTKSTTALSYFRRTASWSTGLEFVSVDCIISGPLRDGVDDAVSLPVIPCAVFKCAFHPDALVGPEYHLRQSVH